jgi:hypothetical protein
MANLDQPKGFWPIRHLLGGEIRTNSYIVTTSAAIYKGDVLKAVAGGTVEVEAADDGAIAMGVAAEYIPAATSATAGTTIQVYDDPWIVFGVQSVTGATPAATEVFATADPTTYAAGSSTTGLSIMELAAAGQAQFKILGLVDEPNNAWGEHADLEVIFNEHLYKGAVAGV